jgi:hypothetical protein
LLYRSAVHEFGEYILLTNFRDYVRRFAERFDVPVRGEDAPMVFKNPHSMNWIRISEQ